MSRVEAGSESAIAPRARFHFDVGRAR